MDGSRRSSEGERKPVTILFTDIAGSTAIAERLDPEEWREVVSGAHRRVTDAVARYEGTIAQLLGDGVLAFFGAPAAHEDDPARAVRSALDIQAAITAYARELAGYVDDFAMRIGIHTGEVVVGELGSAEHAEYLAVGDAVNLAARLQSAAAPGKVLVSESIARLVRGAFELTSLGEITVKGKTAPVAVFEVVRPLTAPARTRGLAVLRSPLVGREAELATLTGALEGLCQGLARSWPCSARPASARAASWTRHTPGRRPTCASRRTGWRAAPSPTARRCRTGRSPNCSRPTWGCRTATPRFAPALPCAGD
jgi:class 3 adenylate cyclase